MTFSDDEKRLISLAFAHLRGAKRETFYRKGWTNAAQDLEYEQELDQINSLQNKIEKLLDPE